LQVWYDGEVAEGVRLEERLAEGVRLEESLPEAGMIVDHRLNRLKMVSFEFFGGSAGEEFWRVSWERTFANCPPT